MRLTSLLALALMVAGGFRVVSAGEADWIPGVVLTADGRFLLGGDKAAAPELGYAFSSPGWKRTVYQSARGVKPHDGFPRVDGDRSLFEGFWDVGEGAVFTVKQTAAKRADGVDCSWEFTHPEGIETENLALLLRLPAKAYLDKTILCNGKAVALPPPEEKTVTLFSAPPSARDGNVVSFVAGDRTVTVRFSGRGMVIASPKREKIEQSFYGLRIFADPVKGKITRATAELSLRLAPWTSESVDLSQAATTGFADEAEGDRQGGWTDQGPTKDLRAMKPGPLAAGTVVFDILDPAKNAGKSAIVLRGGERKYFPETAAVDLGGKPLRQLFLLHATAWGQGSRSTGEVRVEYADGTTDVFPVRPGAAARDWTDGNAGANALPAWRGESPAFGRVYLYRSAFPLKGVPAKRAVFASAGESVWMIAALNGSTEALAPPASAAEATRAQVVYQANKDWVAIDWNPTKVVKGSALDFSRFIEAPAGKYGEIVIRDGRFAFSGAPEKTVRFFGTNLTHETPYQTREGSELLAAKMAAEGFNLARIHLYEQWLTPHDGATEFKPEQKEKLDYLLHCLRQQGIYYVLTVYSGAFFRPGTFTDVPGFADRRLRFEVKPLAMVSDQAVAYMQAFAKTLLASKNPHTGLAPKDDPALRSVELTNENPLDNIRREYPELTPALTKACREHLRETTGRDPTDAEVQTEFNRFMLVLHSRFYQRMKKYLREEQGVAKPISDSNCRESLGYAPVRRELDNVDVHEYWDLYKYVGADFGGGMFTPQGKRYTSYWIRNLDPIKGHWSRPLAAGVSRFFDKPFASGEFNMCYPAPDRAFAVPLESALAGVQDWQMILHYGYASRPLPAINPAPETRLNLSGSPLFLYSDRIGQVLFAQNEVKPSAVKIPLVLTTDYIHRKLRTANRVNPPNDYLRLGFSCQTGIVLADGPTDLSAYPCVVVPPDLDPLPEAVRQVKHFPADAKLLDNLRPWLPGENTPAVKTATTGQVRLDTQAGVFSVATGQSECLLLSVGTPKGAGKALSVSGSQTAATCFLAALDGKPLAESRRMVFLYLTDLKNTGTVIEPESENGFPVTHDQGKLPHLLRQGEIAVEIGAGKRPPPRIHALKYTGEPSEAVAAEATATGFRFKAKAVTAKDAYFAYELRWEVDLAHDP